MSIRSLILMSLVTLGACDDFRIENKVDQVDPAPTAPTGATVDLKTAPLIPFDRACVASLASPDKELTGLLSIDLGEVDRVPDALHVYLADDFVMRLADDGRDGDAVAGDLRYSVAVGADLAGKPETCFDAADISVDLEPVYPLISDEPPGNAKVGGHGTCTSYPESAGDCTECGGQWRAWYRCYGEWPFGGCYFQGYRCYGW